MNALTSRASDLVHAQPVAGPADALHRCLAPMSQLRQQVPAAVKLASDPDNCDRWLSYVEEPYRITHKRRQRAVKLLEQIPLLEELARLQTSATELLERPATPVELGVLMAVLLTSVVDGDGEKAQARAEMLPEVLRQHRDPLSAPVVASAVLAWISREKFMPAISDFVQECINQRLGIRVSQHGIRKLEKLRAQLEAMVAAIGDPSALPACV